MVPEFDDGKAPGALRTIGEVTRALGVRQHVLRYWEEQFPMLRPLKRSGGRRYYRPEDIALIAQIDRLVHHEGFTLRGARQFLEAGGTKPVQAVLPLPAVPIYEDAVTRSEAQPLIAELSSIRDDLAQALADS
ncbi:MerR family transcriptional regulator [Novosphingobium sp. 9U]|uniref:MerR family transcriptional regulator n=1 Tax=Novosphingobium sp. 9U TaxID=2653158 RepID=UPI0012F06841|nr:MerR family transcriptional regulator [Novosphingobium sp. 9U]VWX52355.1 Transcriptional regulator [Novosphingobium sp. 9U]